MGNSAQTSVDPLSGKRIQVMHNITHNGDVYHLRIYSGTHTVCEISGNYYSLKVVREGQKRLANILDMKITHKINKIRKVKYHGK